MLNRRAILAATPALALAGRVSAMPYQDTAGQTPLGAGAVLGFAMLDLESGHVTGANMDTRLPMCSTFKWLLAAMVLARVDAGRDALAAQVPFDRRDLMDYAPRAQARLKAMGGQSARMSVGELCDAAVALSDNTAANLLLRRVGGPSALTAWLRAHGDAVTRLDRWETELNKSNPGDPRDTTTPTAMMRNLQRILYGQVLKPASRKQLLDWMLACETGAERLKAGLPAGWRIAHKTGTWTGAPRNASGDVGVLLPPTGRPILIAAYTAGSTRSTAEVGRWFASLSRIRPQDAMAHGRAHG